MDIIDTCNLARRISELKHAESVFKDRQREFYDANNALELFKAEHSSTKDSFVEEASRLKAVLATLEHNVEKARLALEDWEIQFDEDNLEELSELEYVEREIIDFAKGKTLINESDFEEYCKEFVIENGDSLRNMPDYIVIDWKATADRLRAEHSEVEYQGTVYLYRR